MKKDGPVSKANAFGMITDILPEDPDTWSARTFVSIDTDWACEELLDFTQSLILGSHMPTTWFFTNPSPIQSSIEGEGRAEIGIHPNFNSFLESNPRHPSKFSSSSEVLEELLSHFPLARSIRSHSLLQSERLVDQFLDFGLTHLSNVFIPSGVGSSIRPWRLWGEAIVVPHNWQDNVSLRMPLDFPETPSQENMRVLDFHPIHIFLNTSDLSVVEATRHLHSKPRELERYVFGGKGVRTDFESLMEEYVNGS